MQFNTSLNSQSSNPLPNNITMGFRGFCIGFKHRVDCFDTYANLTHKVNILGETLEKTPYSQLNAILFAGLFLSISVFSLCCGLSIVVGKGLWIDAAIVFSLSLPVFPATAIMVLYKYIEREIVSFGYSVIVGPTQLFGWISLGCSAGAAVITMGVFFVR